MQLILELFEFLSDPRVQIRNTATKYVAGLTGQADNRDLFKLNDFKAVHDLAKLIDQDPLTAHDALSALINLSSDVAIVDALAGDAFIRALVIQIILPKNVNADMACMLLNNLSKHQSVSTLLLPEVLPESSTHHIDNLLELFGKEENTYNPAASYHFLGGVFANLSSCPQGCRFFLGQSTVDKTIRLSKVIMFTEHKDLIRRGGAVSTLKNVAFGVNVDAGRGLEILIDPSLNLLVYILLPLSGPEDYTDDEMEGMPEELQLLDTDKKRESDERIRHALVDTLLLMCGTLQGREYLRSLKVYDVIKKLHLQEQSEEVQETIEKLVNMLMRDEAQVDGEHDQQQR